MSRGKRIRRAFDRDTLAGVCEMPEHLFGEYYGLDMTRIDSKCRRPGVDDYYFHGDNGSDILFVAHLDTVVRHEQRTCRFLDTDAGTVVYSGALDDRLGAYIGLEWLPALGITYDVLLTTGEETGRSTAEFFETEKEYNYIIEFDRRGIDVVTYDYGLGPTGEALEDLIRDSGAKVGEGIFSDICYLDHLGVKGINWGVGYQDYHGPRSHAYLDDTFMMLGHYLRFHAANSETAMPHVDWAQERAKLDAEDDWKYEPWDEYQPRTWLTAEEAWHAKNPDVVDTADEEWVGAHGADEYVEQGRWR